MKAIDLTGMKFGTLTVLEFDEERHAADVAAHKAGLIKRVRRYYKCRCDRCGNIVTVRGENLVSKNTTSCGSCHTPRKRRGNEYRYDSSKECYIGKASNTDAEFMVDKEDFDNVSKWTWYETSYGYMMTRVAAKKQIFLHRFICGQTSPLTDEYVVDHINRNTLDNRRSNLRVTSSYGNARNHSLSKSNSSGVTGVSYYKPGNKYRAYIQDNDKFVSLGYFDTLDDAIAARKEAEGRIYGEYAPAR